MHLGGGVIDGDAAGFFLLLLFRIVGSEIGRDTLPSVTVVAGAEQELRADVESPFLVGTHVNGRVPVEAQLLLFVQGQWLNTANFVGNTVHAADGAALRFGVDVSGVGGIDERPKAITAIDVFPARVADAARK